MNDHFKVGTVVALIHSSQHGESISRRTVCKVRKDGRFYVSVTKANGETVQADTMYTPVGDTPEAKCKRVSAFSIERVEVWGERHAAMYLEQANERKSQLVKEFLISKIEALNPRLRPDRQILSALKDVLVE